MYQRLGDMNNSVKQYFPNDWYIMLHNCARMKDPFKAQDRPMDFIVTGGKDH